MTRSSHHASNGDSPCGGVSTSPFGTASDGAEVLLYTLRTRTGLLAQISTWGAIVTSLRPPDRDGQHGEIVLGFDSLAGYRQKNAYFGALIGRYANRIARGRFALNGICYRLPINDGRNTLHGGLVGLDKVSWLALQACMTAEGPMLKLQHSSRDGDQGFPGNLSVTATFTLAEQGALRIDYSATSDKDTVINLTQHTYFNLRGSGDVLGHIVTIDADRFLPVDDHLIPTGELRAVENTPFDFRHPVPIGARIDAEYEQLRLTQGYDHTFVLRRESVANLRLDATVYEPESGRILEVWSTQPGVQFYTGNQLDGTARGRSGRPYDAHSGLCLEPQHFPDSPNQPHFPTSELKSGETYRSTIEYRFTCDKPS